MARFFKLSKCSDDGRRTIYEMVFEDGEKERIETVQIKIIALKSEAVKSEMAVGNHFHTPESGRDEIFVAIGPDDGQALLKFAAEPNNYTHLRAFDGVFVSCGEPHAFVPLREGVVLFGISNTKYDSVHDVAAKIL